MVGVQSSCERDAHHRGDASAGFNYRSETWVSGEPRAERDIDMLNQGQRQSEVLLDSLQNGIQRPSRLLVVCNLPRMRQSNVLVAFAPNDAFSLPIPGLRHKPAIVM